jgi:predicted TIM-barrel fold metal-dependent hydrolase
MLFGAGPFAAAQGPPAPPDGRVEPSHQTPSYQRMKTYLDSIPAIDTHSHLQPFDIVLPKVETARGFGANLAGLWHSSYYSWTDLLTPWKPRMSFDEWWAQGKENFVNTRTLGFYRAMRVAILDLYGIDFNTLTDEQARDLDNRLFENYQNPKWLYEVITKKANIELEFEDPFWDRLEFRTDYKFSVMVFNVTTLAFGPNPSTLMPEFKRPSDDPGVFAQKWGQTINSLDDYLNLIDRMFAEAKEKGAACIKTTIAYERTLQFNNVPKQRADQLFPRRANLSPEEAKDLEDFIMWRLPEFSVKYGLPFQIHTGLAHIEGSNPMNLVPLIRGNPQTKFILFHGGFPWVGETGAIAFSRPNVWIDCNWLPMVCFPAAKRAFNEWLDLFATNRIMWGSDSKSAEEIYAGAELMRRCWAEVLAERVDQGDLSEQEARHIGRQVLRENALEMFPQLKKRLWKDKGEDLKA